MNSRSLLQNKASFGSDPLAKFCRFFTETRVGDPGTFVADGGYHCVEVSELSSLGPRVAAKTLRRPSSLTKAKATATRAPP